jgi:hypothetical protein
MINNRKAGRQALPPERKRVQLTITISPEADAIVTQAVAEPGTRYQNNRSLYIESRILQPPPPITTGFTTPNAIPVLNPGSGEEAKLAEIPEASNRAATSLEKSLAEILATKDRRMRAKLCADVVARNGSKPLEFLKEAQIYGAWTEGIADKADLREKAKEIAAAVGKSVNHITNCLNLLDSGRVILRMIERDQVSASLAIELFLVGRTKNDWSTVEEALVQARVNAALEGKPKVSRRYLPEDLKDAE